MENRQVRLSLKVLEILPVALVTEGTSFDQSNYFNNSSEAERFSG